MSLIKFSEIVCERMNCFCFSPIFQWHVHCPIPRRIFGIWAAPKVWQRCCRRLWYMVGMVTYVWLMCGLFWFWIGWFLLAITKSKTWDWPFRCRHFTVLSLVALDVIILDMVFAADAGRDGDTTFVEFWSRTNDSTGLELKPRSVVHGMQHVEVTVILLRHAATWTQLKNRHNFLP